jgi:hypothetical protein
LNHEAHREREGKRKKRERLKRKNRGKSQEKETSRIPSPAFDPDFPGMDSSFPFAIFAFSAVIPAGYP